MDNNKLKYTEMKKTSLILSIIALAAVVGLAIFDIVKAGSKKTVETEVPNSAAEVGAIVYFNMDRLINEYDMANDLSSVVETKVQSIEQELNRRGNKLQSDVNAFQEKIDKGLLTRSVAEAQSQKLQNQQNEFQNYYNQKQQEMQEEQAVMMNQIADAIKTFIDKYNEEKQYALILSTSGNILPQPVVAGNTALDITDELLEGLNEEYIKTKNAK